MNCPNQCDNCTGIRKIQCQLIYRTTIDTVRTIDAIGSEHIPEGREELLSIGGHFIEQVRTETQEAFQQIGCLLTTDQIDQNLTFLKEQ